MEGHVRKQGDRYYVKVELDRDPVTGERKRRSLGGYDTQREARKVLRDALERGDKGWAGPQRLTLGAYLSRWLEGVDLSLAASTAANYRTNCEAYITPHIGAVGLQQLTAVGLTSFYAELAKGGRRNGRGLAPRTILNVHRTLKKALGDAVAAHLLAFDPTIGAKVPRQQKVERPTWSAADLQAFLAATADDDLGPLIALGATTGMRRSELLGLRWEDVDVAAKVLKVRHARVQFYRDGEAHVVDKEPKTERSRRTVPLHPVALAALKRQKAQQRTWRLAAGPVWEDSGLVFTDYIGRGLRPGAMSKTFDRLVTAAGLPKLSPHGLRHTFATLGLEAGVNVVYISELIGHSSPAITMDVYQHSNAERSAEAMQQIGDAIAGT